MKPPFFTWFNLPHLPKVPDHFVSLAHSVAVPVSQDANNQLINQGQHTLEYKHRTIYIHGKPMKSRCQEAFDMGEEFRGWCRDNIFPMFDEASVRLSVGDSETHGAHVDNPGKIRFYYLIDRGGESAETVFYYRPGSPLVWDMDNHHDATPVHHNNLDELIVLDRARFPLQQWVLFNGYVMHGVNNVTGSRLNFTVSVRPEHLALIPNVTTSL